MPREFKELDHILAYFAPGLESNGEDLLGMPLTEAELDAFEARYSFALPHILRAFYLQHNGMGEEISRGSPHHCIAPLQSLGEVGGSFRNTLYNHAHDLDGERKLKKSERDLYEPDPVDALFPLGMDASGDVYFLDLRRRSGEGIPVFLLHHDAAFEIDSAADSFEAFVFDFLLRNLGEQEGSPPPAMPRWKLDKKDARALVRDALPRPSRPAVDERKPTLVEPRILSELGRTNWRHSSSPEGATAGIVSGLFTSSGQLITLGGDTEIHAWNMASGTIDRSFRPPDAAEPDRILLSPDETKLAVFSKEEYDSDTTITTILNFSDGTELCRFNSDFLIDFRFSKDSSECIAISKNAIAVHSAKTGRKKSRQSWKGHQAKHAALSSDGRILVTDSEGSFPLHVRDAAGGRIREIARPTGIEEPAIPENEIHHVGFGSDDSKLIVFLEGAFTIHDLQQNTTTRLPFPFTESDYKVTWTGGALLTAMEYRREKYSRVGFDIALVNAGSGGLISRHSFDFDPGNVVAPVSPDRARMALLCTGGLRADLISLPEWKYENAQDDMVSDATLEAVTEDGFVLFSGSTVRFTDRAGRLHASRNFPGEGLFSASAGPDGSMVIVTDSSHHVRVLSLPALEDLVVFKTPSFSKAGAFHPTDGRALIGCDDGTLLLYAADTKKPAKLPPWLKAYTSQVSWSPDGTLALAADGVKAILFDVAKRRLINDKLAQGEFTWAVDFSPDGSRLLVAGRDVSLRVLQLNGKELLRVPDVDVMRAWFMKDGRILVFQMDGSVLFLDGSTGLCVGEYTMRDTSDCVLCVIPGPDRSHWFLKSSRGRLMQCEL